MRSKENLTEALDAERETLDEAFIVRKSPSCMTIEERTFLVGIRSKCKQVEYLSETGAYNRFLSDCRQTST